MAEMTTETVSGSGQWLRPSRAGCPPHLQRLQSRRRMGDRRSSGSQSAPDGPARRHAPRAQRRWRMDDQMERPDATGVYPTHSADRGPTWTNSPGLRRPFLARCSAGSGRLAAGQGPTPSSLANALAPRPAEPGLPWLTGLGLSDIARTATGAVGPSLADLLGPAYLWPPGWGR